MLTYNLDRRGGLSVYAFLYKCLRDDILNGVLKANTRLPSRRGFAEHLRVSAVTIENAYRQLEAEGYIYILPRRGAYVSADIVPDVGKNKNNKIIKNIYINSDNNINNNINNNIDKNNKKYKLDLSGGRIDNNNNLTGFPAATWAKLARRILSEKQEALLQPIPHQGLLEPRQAIARYLRDFKGMNISPEQVVIGAGAEYLYILIAQLLGPEITFALEDPGYPKISMVYEKCGAKRIFIPADEQGININILAQSDAQAAHLSPAYHGAVMSAGRRHALSRWAERVGGYLIEDDFDSEFYFTGRPIPTLQSMDHSGRVFYLNTFSQTISPAMRMGYLILPPDALNIYQRELGFYACTVPALEQLILARFLGDGYFERHLARLRKAYKIRRAEILDAFRRAAFARNIAINEQGAGLRFLLRIDTNRPDEIIKNRAESLGVKLKFLSDYAASPRPEYAHNILINCAGLNPEDLKLYMPLLEEIFQ